MGRVTRALSILAAASIASLGCAGSAAAAPSELATDGPPLLLVVVLPLGVLLGLGMSLVFRWHRRNPYMSGALVATTADGMHLHRDLEGLRADRFPRPRTRATPDVGGEFRVRGVRRGGVVVPQVVYHPEGGLAQPPEICVIGHPTEVYGVSMYYTGQQR